MDHTEFIDMFENNRFALIHAINMAGGDGANLLGVGDAPLRHVLSFMAANHIKLTAQYIAPAKLQQTPTGPYPPMPDIPPPDTTPVVDGEGDSND